MAQHTKYVSLPSDDIPHQKRKTDCLKNAKRIALKTQNGLKEAQVPLCVMVITSGEMAYTRDDGVKVVPIGTLRD